MHERLGCPLCQTKGIYSSLRSYQINLDEAILLCDNSQCDFPLRQSTQHGHVFTRDFQSIPEVQVKDNTSLELQQRVASHMASVNGRQRTVSGTQTGSHIVLGPKASQRVNTNRSSSRNSSIASSKRSAISQTTRQASGFDGKSVDQSEYTLTGCTSLTQSTPVFPGLQLGGSRVNSVAGSPFSANEVKHLSDASSKLNCQSLGNEHQKKVGSTNGSSQFSSSDKMLFGTIEKEMYPGLMLMNQKMDSITKSTSCDAGYNNARTLNTSSVQSSVLESSNLSCDSYVPDSNVEAMSVNNENVKSLVIKRDSTAALNDFTSKRKRNSDTKKKQQPISRTNPDESCTISTYLSTRSSTSMPASPLMSSSPMTVDSLPDYPSKFLQWRNRDSLCWLDVVLCLMVHNVTLKRALHEGRVGENTVIQKLLIAHHQAQLILHSRSGRNSAELPILCETSLVSSNDSGELKKNVQELQKVTKRLVTLVGTQESVAVKTGAGESRRRPSSCLVRDSKSVAETKCCRGTMPGARALLDQVREDIWNSVKGRLKCERGQKDSPVFTFPLVLQQDPSIEAMFKMKYSFTFTCKQCGETEKTSHERVMPTLPNVVSEFDIAAPAHHRKCFKCGNTDSTRHLVYDTLPNCLLIHFTEGLQDTNWEKLEFGFHGNQYRVTGIVQYINSPDHFIAWLRNPQDNRWMKCDDLASAVCRFQARPPALSPKEVHIVMWERLVPEQSQTNLVTGLVPEKSQQKVPLAETGSLVEKMNARNVKTDSTSSKLLFSQCAEDKDKVYGCAAVTGADVKVNAESSAKIKRKFVPLTFSSCSLKSGQSCNSSVSSDSALSVDLPEFVSTTTASSSLLKPIPCWSTCQTEQGSALQLLKSADDSNPRTNSGVHAQCISSTATSVTNGAFAGDRSVSIPRTCISGASTVIKPSSVFCVPSKSGATTAVSSRSTHQDVYDLRTVPVQITHDATAHHPVPNGVGNGHVINVLNGSTKTNNSKKSKSTSTQISAAKFCGKFRLPLMKRKMPSLSQDAFPILKLGQTTSTKSSSLSSTSTSCASSPSVSPAANGGPGYLSSIKHYLMNKATTCKNETAAKFEGLNLKSAPNLKRGMSLDSMPLCRTSSQCSSDRVLSPLSECFGRKDSSSERNSDVGGARKRKCSDITAQAEATVQKSKDVLSPDSFKENNNRLKSDSAAPERVEPKCSALSTRNRPLPPRIPSIGKKMKLIQDFVHKRENQSETSHKTADNPPSDANGGVWDCTLTANDEGSNKLHPSPQKCENDAANVLQDLYEALNIPYPTMQAMMSEVISDVDDLLGIVTPGDLHTTSCSFSSSPSACATGSSFSQTQEDFSW